MATTGVVERQRSEVREFLDQVESLIDRFLVSVDVSETTKSTYEHGLRSFFNWFEDQNYRLEQPAIKAYKEYLQDKFAANTVSTYIVALRRFFDWAVNSGIFPYNPAENIKGAKSSRTHLREDLSLEEVKSVLGCIDSSDEMGARDRAIITLMVKNGLRISEVKNLNLGDLSTQSGRKVLYVKGKGRDEKDEFVVLSPETEKVLNRYLAYRENTISTKPLFAGVGNRNHGGRLTAHGIGQRVYGYFKQAGIKRDKITVHSLRHSFVTLLISNGASLEKTRTAARHQSTETTRRYYHEHDRLTDPIEDKLDKVLTC